jgi:hypothetical protein
MRSRTTVVLAMVLMFATGLMVGEHEGSKPPVPPVDSHIEILHYHDCFDLRSPVGWGNLISVAGGEYVESPLHINEALTIMCPELYEPSVTA